MHGSSGDGQPGLEELILEVRNLEERVRRLETHLGLTPAAPALTGAGVHQTVISAAPPLDQTTELIPVLGKALLAIAAAYLLRALAEARVLPMAVCAAAGILYSFFWLWMAARAAPGRRGVAMVHGATSALVLAPLLWESTLRFAALSPQVAAASLVGYAAFGLRVSWRRNLDVVAWIATLTALATATALLLATKDLPPFTAAVLAVAAAVELSACFSHWLRERWLAALLANLLVLLLTYIAARPQGVPEGYAPITALEVLAAQIALLAIYLGSTVVRTLVRGFTITVFETAQCVAAFLICLDGVLRVYKGDQAATIAAGMFLLGCGAACYAVSHVVLEDRPLSHRNFHTYSFFALALALAGSRILFNETILGWVWGAAGVSCVWLAGRSGKSTLGWHGLVYLLCLLVSSGLLSWCGARLLGPPMGWAQLGAPGWVAAGSLAVAHAFSSARDLPPQAPWEMKARALALAAGALWCAAGFGAGATSAACMAIAGEVRTAAVCATLSTAVLTCLALAAAWVGRKRQRRQFSWVVYPLMVFTAYKLLIQDLQGNHKLALFASLLLYGGALVVLPRLLQGRLAAGGSSR